MTALVLLIVFLARPDSGVLLVLAFLVGPYLTARLFSNRLSTLLALTPALGILASIVGVALSRHFLSVYGLPLSTGGLVVCTIGLFYLFGVFTKSIFRGKVAFFNRNPCDANELPS